MRLPLWNSQLCAGLVKNTGTSAITHSAIIIMAVSMQYYATLPYWPLAVCIGYVDRLVSALIADGNLSTTMITQRQQQQDWDQSLFKELSLILLKLSVYINIWYSLCHCLMWWWFVCVQDSSWLSLHNHYLQHQHYTCSLCSLPLLHRHQRTT